MLVQLTKLKTFDLNKEYKIAEIISNQELLVSTMFEVQALIRILERKGIKNEQIIYSITLSHCDTVHP